MPALVALAASAQGSYTTATRNRSLPIPVVLQIAIGSLMLLACAALHISVVAGMVAHLRHHSSIAARHARKYPLVAVGVVFLGSLASHTLHIYICAFVLWNFGALSGYEEPIYYTLVTYTTVGYGDVVLGPDFRIMGAMISVTGIVMFGVTTAFLVGIFSRILGENRI